MIRLYEAAKEMADLDTQAELARRLNTSSQRIKNWESRGVSQGGANQAQEVLGINSTYVLSGVGDVAVGRRRAADDIKANEIAPDHARIEHLSEFGHPAGSRFLVLPEFLVLPKIGDADLRNIRWLRAPTASMAPEIERGALVFVDSSVNTHAAVVDGLTYAYSLWGGPGLKRVLIRKDHWTVWGRGKEAEPSDVAINALDDLEIYGVVVGHFNLS